jgi:RNA polymerase sigma-70 factor (ECF subfamily)
VDADQLLIDRALTGHREAFGELVVRYQDRLFASMLGVTGSSEESEDVVQEAFVRAFLKLDTFKSNSQFFTWLYRIAFNVALSRHRKRRSKVSLDLGDEGNQMDPIDKSESPDEPMLRDERVEMVHIALDQLSEDHRAVLVLRELEDASYEDISEILNISIGTVRSRISRARAQLKIALETLDDPNSKHPRMAD